MIWERVEAEHRHRLDQEGCLIFERVSQLLLGARAEFGIVARDFNGVRIGGFRGALDLADDLLEPISGTVGVSLSWPNVPR
jgi:hypothetical protein